MNKINQKRQKGSATILVILIVLTVVMFGVINMMTVYTSYKISQKNMDWSRSYYEFDSKANIFVNNIDKNLKNYKIGEEIDTQKFLAEIEKNMQDNNKILINGNKVQLPVDTNENIVQNNYINLAVYFLDKDENKSFYIDLDIPSVKSEENYKVLYWNRVSEDFQYNTQAEFAEGEVIIIQ